MNDYRKTPGFNCLPNSAWHTWQLAGHAWREQHPDASNENARQAALAFSLASDYPDIGKDARRRAFAECAIVNK